MSSIFNIVANSTRASRAANANFTVDALHGSTHDISAMDGSLANVEGDWGAAVYSSSSIDDVNANYAGEGPDLSNRLEARADQLVGEIHNIHTMPDSRYNSEHTKAMNQARSEIAGNNQGVVYPLKINTENFVTIDKNNSTMIDGRDYRADAELELNRSDYDSNDDYEDAVEEYSYDLQDSDYDSNLATVADSLRQAGVDGDEIQNVLEGFDGDSVSATDLDAAIRGLNFYPEPEDGIGSLGGLSSKVLQDLGFKGVIDKTVNDKFGDNRKNGQAMEGVDADTTHYIHFPGSENQIRSINAQFDPAKKSSSNLLAGGAAATVGAGAMFESNPALAGTTPLDNTDMSALTLIPELVTSVINDIHKYGKQVYTGDKDDGRLLDTPESEGDAVTIKNAISKVADWALNYKNKGLLTPEDGISANDMISGAMDAYNENVRPALVDALGEAGANRVEGTGLLAAVLAPSRGAKVDLEMPTVDRDMSLLQNVGDVNRVNNLKVEYGSGPALLDNPIMKAEDVVDRSYVSGMSDTSRGALETLQSINGEEYKTLFEGGQDFMRQQRNAERGILWANDKKAIPGIIGAGRAAQKLSPNRGSPLFLPYQMMGRSSDFATFSTDIMVPYAQRNMDAASKKALDKTIRDFKVDRIKKDGTTSVSFPMKDWVGIDHPEVMTYLKNGGAKRKQVLYALEKFKGDVGIGLSEVRAIIADPTQLNPRTGNLYNVGEFASDFGFGSSPHNTYNGSFYGKHLGQFGEPNDGKPFNIVTDLNPMKRGKKPFPEDGSQSTLEDYRTVWEKAGHNLNAKKVPAPVSKSMQAGMIGKFTRDDVDAMVKRGILAD